MSTRPAIFNRSSYSKKVESIFGLLRLASQKSYWYLTPQEIQLFGGIFDEKFLTYPHTPIILAGSATHSKIQIANIGKERNKIGMSLALSGFFFDTQAYDFDGMQFVLCTLEKLDTNGNTVQDPVAIDETGRPVPEAVISGKFPFRRDK